LDATFSARAPSIQLRKGTRITTCDVDSDHSQAAEQSRREFDKTLRTQKMLTAAADNGDSKIAEMGLSDVLNLRKEPAQPNLEIGKRSDQGFPLC
jgi:hypothetical protein